MIIKNTGDAHAEGPGAVANTGYLAPGERHVDARDRCKALVGKKFRSPKGGVVGEFVSVLERRMGRPPVVVGKLPDGTVLRYTPRKGESLVIE